MDPLSTPEVSAGNLIAFVLLLAFAIDRAAHGILFVFLISGFWRRWHRYVVSDLSCSIDGASPTRNEKKIAYFIVAGGLAVFILAYLGDGSIGLVHSIGGPAVDPLFEIFVTALVLVTGSDFLSRLLEMSGIYIEERSRDDRPIEISGTLVLRTEEELARNTRATANRVA